MKKLLAILLIGVLAAGIVFAQAQKSGSCDRACLESIADRYIAAMVAHDASGETSPLLSELTTQPCS